MEAPDRHDEDPPYSQLHGGVPSSIGRHVRVVVGAAIALALGTTIVSLYMPAEATEVTPTNLAWNDRSGFESVVFKRDTLASHMDYPGCDGLNAVGRPIPRAFTGLWWMDGNPVPEYVASFGHADWTAGVEACRKTSLDTYTPEEKESGTVVDDYGDSAPCQGRLVVAFWEDRRWAFPNNAIGHAYEKVGTAADSHMEFVCGGPNPDNLTICKLGASVGPGADRLAVDEALKALLGLGVAGFNFALRFTMVKIDENNWIRYSAGHVHQYYFKRIINCSGNQVQPYWNQFNSGGKAVPVPHHDVYGHGWDKRATVTNAISSLFVRSSIEGRCRSHAGGTCAVLGCFAFRGAMCVSRECICGPGKCAQDGQCYTVHNEQCDSLDTNGTCRIFGCSGSRDAACINGQCLCVAGKCAVGGACIAKR